MAVKKPVTLLTGLARNKVIKQDIEPIYNGLENVELELEEDTQSNDPDFF